MNNYPAKKILVFGLLIIGALMAIPTFTPNISYDDDDRVKDMRVRTAIYQAASESIKGEKVGVMKLSSSTYKIKNVSGVSSAQLEKALTSQLQKHGLEMDIELGVFRAADDTLVYGSYIPFGGSFKTKSDVLNDELSNVMIHLRNDAVQSAMINGWSMVPTIGALMIVLLVVFFIVKDKTSFLEPILSQLEKKETLKESVLELGDFQYDQDNLLLSHPAAQRQLTYKEGKLLTFFFRQPNALIERNLILKHVWEDEGVFVARSMDVFISRLRKYLDADPNIKLENVRGIGYVLRYSS